MKAVPKSGAAFCLGETMKEKIKAFAQDLKIEYLGVLSAEPMEELKSILEKRRSSAGITPFEESDLEKRTDPSKTLPGAKSILVCLFPYSAEDRGAENVSKYARIPDYHRVVMAYLRKICDYIRVLNPESNLMAFVDNGPLADKYLAFRAGLGFFGKNSLLINEQYGSFFFIGYIITDLDLEPDKPLGKTCSACGACVRACPGGAIGEKGGFCAERCVSYLTQIKTLTEEQKKILSAQGSVYGCDICQNVCPHNRGIKKTPIPEFSFPKLLKLEKETISAMSGREFKRVYQEFPFSWRGKDALLKNFDK